MRQRVNLVLQDRFGRRPQSRAISGSVVWVKAAVWMARRKMSWIEKQNADVVDGQRLWSAVRAVLAQRRFSGA